MPEMILVPHTHWDREWYEPHEVFRLRLVHALDEIVARAEADREFCFTLDGQSAAIDDYLEIRPENRERVAALSASGQLALGPWYILLDEHLCSGETIVRNLELGMRVARELGGYMPVGHLPDMFGHTAQTPQILAGFGIRYAAMWRGVPARIDAHAFAWRAPDGSQVRAENLFDGYANALDLFTIPEQFGERLEDYAVRSAPWWGGDTMLGLVGSDHTAPNPALMDMVRAYRASADPSSPATVTLQVATLGDYLARFDPYDPRLAVVDGEMRSHCRGNLLPGVFSIRTNLKADMARAELLVTQAERLDALYGGLDHATALDLAWKRIIESTAHDSVTGCGVDDTADQVSARLASAGHIGRAVRDTALGGLIAAVPADAALVVNPLPIARPCLIEVEVDGPADARDFVGYDSAGEPLPTQWVAALPTELGDEIMASDELDRVLHRVHGRELFGQLVDEYGWGEGSLEFLVAKAPTHEVFDLAQLRRELTEAAQQPGPWHVVTTAAPRHRVLVELRTPPLGSAAVRVVPADASSRPAGAALGSAGADAAGNVTGSLSFASSIGVTVSEQDERISLTNGTVSIVVRGDGLLDLTGADGTTLTGVGRLVDEGDRGDSYNFGPLANAPTIETPESVEIEVLERGPLRGRVRVRRTYLLPRELGGDPDTRAAETAVQVVDTVVELRRHEGFARVTLDLVNRVADHRLRWHLPLGARVETSVASGQFGIVTRGRTAEGGWGEFPLPTFPAAEFVAAGPAQVGVAKVSEYELVDDAAGTTELALTLVRAVGMMSVNVHPLRDEPAGSEIPVPGAQYLDTRVVTQLAVGACAAGWEASGVALWSESLRHEALAYPGRGARGAQLPVPTEGVEVHGPAVLSSLRRRGGGLETRVISVSASEQTISVTGMGDQVLETTLAGERITTHPAGAIPLPAYRILTLREAR